MVGKWLGRFSCFLRVFVSLWFHFLFPYQVYKPYFSRAARMALAGPHAPPDNNRILGRGQDQQARLQQEPPRNMELNRPAE